MKIGASVLAFLGAAFIGAQADALPAYDQSQPRTVVFEGHGEAAYGGAVSGFCYDCDGADGSSDFKSDVSVGFVFDIDIVWEPELYEGIFVPYYFVNEFSLDVDGRRVSTMRDEDGSWVMMFDTIGQSDAWIDPSLNGCGVFWKQCQANGMESADDARYFVWLKEVAGTLFDYETDFSSVTPFKTMSKFDLEYEAGLPVSRNPDASGDGDFEAWLYASGTLRRTGGWIAAVPLPGAGALFGPALLGTLGALRLHGRLKARAASRAA